MHACTYRSIPKQPTCWVCSDARVCVVADMLLWHCFACIAFCILFCLRVAHTLDVRPSESLSCFYIRRACLFQLPIAAEGALHCHEAHWDCEEVLCVMSHTCVPACCLITKCRRLVGSPRPGPKSSCTHSTGTCIFLTLTQAVSQMSERRLTVRSRLFL